MTRTISLVVLAGLAVGATFLGGCSKPEDTSASATNGEIQGRQGGAGDPGKPSVQQAKE